MTVRCLRSARSRYAANRGEETPTEVSQTGEQFGEAGVVRAAFEDARRGWFVLPIHGIQHGVCTCGNQDCRAAGKHPRITNWTARASQDYTAIRDWHRRWPDSNHGILTGSRSGIVVVDIDPRNGGEDSLAELERQYGALPHTVEAITGGRGRHLFFEHPGGVVRSSTSIAPGIDIRGDGACIVAPPSIHHSGTTYTWETSSHPDDVGLARMPDWLLSLIRGDQDKSSVLASERIPQGRRNNTLFRMAGSMRRQGFGPDAIEAALLVENTERCDPPLEATEVRAIFRSIARYPPDLSLSGASDSCLPGGLVEYRGDHLLMSDEFGTQLDYLPLLEQEGYFVKGWSHLLAAYPRVGKTELMVRNVASWTRSGLKVLYLSEESAQIWYHRLRSGSGSWENLSIVCGLGASPNNILNRAFSGDEDVVIVDTLRNLLGLQDEKDNSEIARRINPWIAQARATSKTLIMVHHDTKAGGEHGRAIAGGHALLGSFDIALEILHDSNNRARRLVRGYPRLITISELVYELGNDGEMRALGEPSALGLEDVKNQARLIVSEDRRTLKEIHALMPEPRPSG